MINAKPSREQQYYFLSAGLEMVVKDGRKVSYFGCEMSNVELRGYMSEQINRDRFFKLDSIPQKQQEDRAKEAL